MLDPENFWVFKNGGERLFGANSPTYGSSFWGYTIPFYQEFHFEDPEFLDSISQIFTAFQDSIPLKSNVIRPFDQIQLIMTV